MNLHSPDGSRGWKESCRCQSGGVRLQSIARKKTTLGLMKLQSRPPFLAGEHNLVVLVSRFPLGAPTDDGALFHALVKLQGGQLLVG